ncbi:MAG: hypothetical protein AAGF11_36260 [Myxococcota bacterium]
MTSHSIVNLSSLLVDGPQDPEGRLILRPLPDGVILVEPEADASGASEISVGGRARPPDPP